jgi:hypothetical protein
MDNMRILQRLRVPARLTVEQTGALLGFHPDAVYFLAKRGLLRALGEGNDVQLMFAAIHIRRLCSDERWLARRQMRFVHTIEQEMPPRNPNAWAQATA